MEKDFLLLFSPYQFDYHKNVTIKRCYKFWLLLVKTYKLEYAFLSERIAPQRFNPRQIMQNHYCRRSLFDSLLFWNGDTSKHFSFYFAVSILEVTIYSVMFDDMDILAEFCESKYFSLTTLSRRQDCDVDDVADILYQVCSTHFEEIISYIKQSKEPSDVLNKIFGIWRQENNKD